MSQDCLVCGRANPIGMQVQFVATLNGAEATIKPAAQYQGYPGVLHGGMVTALMDDAMWWAVYATHRAITLTAEIHVRYKKPTPVEQELLVRAEVTAARANRLFVTAAKIIGPDGAVLAEATGKFMAAPPDMADQLRRGME